MLTILEEAQDVYGHYLDGDEDGVPGSHFILTFRTGPADMSPPEIIAVIPPNVSQNVELSPIVNIQFYEIIGPDSLVESFFFLERFQDHSGVEGEWVHYDVFGRSSICFFPFNSLHPDEVYVTRIYSGLIDNFNNSIPINHSYSFNTGNIDLNITIIDAMEQSSGSTTGIITDSTSMLPNMETINGLYGSTQSMEINYGWNSNSSNWLIRVYLSGGSPRDVTFNDTKTMQAYVFGDGSGNKFRFAVDDNLPSTGAEYHEVSPWYIIDWIGWKLVHWDLDLDGTGDWIGDGQLDGTMRFDSFQLTYSAGQAQFGKIYIDDFRIVDEFELSINTEALPTGITLTGNYPNPFNPTTKIKFQTGDSRRVSLTVYDILGNKIKELTNSIYEPGEYYLIWDGTNINGEKVSSGVYIYSLMSDDIKNSGRMILLK